MMATVQLVLWVAGGASLAAVGGLMLVRRCYREFPIFFCYIVSQVVRFAALFWVYKANDALTYRYVRTAAEAMDAVLSFAVIYELYSLTFRAYEGIRELGSILLRWAAAVLLIIATVTAASGSGADQDRFLAGLFAAERSVAIIRGGLLFLLFLLHGGLGLRWNRRAFGVALGFALLSSFGLVAYTMRMHLGDTVTDVLSLMNTVVFDASVAVWIIAMLVPLAERPRVLRVPRWDLEAWNRTLLEVLHR